MRKDPRECDSRRSADGHAGPKCVGQPAPLELTKTLPERARGQANPRIGRCLHSGADCLRFRHIAVAKSSLRRGGQAAMVRLRRALCPVQEE
jgi:hypothetical protein